MCRWKVNYCYQVTMITAAPNYVLEPLRFVTRPAGGEQYQKTDVLAELHAACECHKDKMQVCILALFVQFKLHAVEWNHSTSGLPPNSGTVASDHSHFFPYFIVAE